MRSMTAKAKTIMVAGVAALAGVTSLVAAPQTAAAAPNDCNQPTLYRDSAPVGITGTLYHTCSAGTQVSYQIDCFISDSYYTHYFATDSTLVLKVGCPYSMGPLIGIYDYNFS